MARTATTISWAGCGHGCGCIDITHSILRPETGNVDRSTILPSRAPTRSTGRTRPWRVRRVAELTSRINVIGQSILSERTWRTWDRLRATPTSTLELLIGKAVPLLVVLGAQQTLLLGFATVAIGLRPAGPAWALIPAGLAWSLCVLACGAALASSARSHGQLGTAVDIGALVATCLGGALIPLSALPAWLRSVAWVSPGYWAMAGYHAALTGQSATRLLPPCGVLLAIAVAAAALAATRTSHAQGRSRYL